ncbi:MAG: tetratricopeptide repeat protein, partial [Methylosarcina sp.]
MNAENYLKQGDLKAALKELQDQVRSNPGKADYRIFLFQLLSVLGQWDRALTQLNVAGE